MNKINIKGRGRIISAIIIALLTLVVLTQPAFALTGNGTGSGSVLPGAPSDAATVVGSLNPIMWRVTLYVSTNADGKIKDTDTINNGLARVGETVYYDYATMYHDSYYLAYSFVQAGSSALLRANGSFNPSAQTSPKMVPLATNGGLDLARSMVNERGQYINIYYDRIDLFQYSEAGNFDSTDAKLKGSEAGKHVTKIIDHITKSTASGAFWNNVINSIHGNIKAELTPDKNPGMTSIEAAQNRLLPALNDAMNPNCLVDWAVVIEPMMMLEYHRDIDWNIDSYYKAALLEDNKKRNFAVDAYWLSATNEKYGGVIKDDLGSSAYGITANMCHDVYKPDGQSHHGVICSSVDGTSNWAGIDKSIYAIRGGICLYTITRDTGVPIRYYHYTYKSGHRQELFK